MYKKRTLLPVSEVGRDVMPFCDDVRIARPVSYFVNGGVDLNGVSNRPPIPGTSSDAESISSGEIDVFTDPTVGRMDLMDYAGVVGSESMARSMREAEDV